MVAEAASVAASKDSSVRALRVPIQEVHNNGVLVLIVKVFWFSLKWRSNSISNLRASARRHIAMSDKLAPRLYLVDVLTHIANHVMDEGDVQAWLLVSDRQKEFFSELSQKERDKGHRVIREPKEEVLSEPLATRLPSGLFDLVGLGCGHPLSLALRACR